MRKFLLVILATLGASLTITNGVASATTGFIEAPASDLVTAEGTLMQPANEIDWDAARYYSSSDQMKTYAAQIESSVIAYNLSVGVTPPRAWHFVPAGKYIQACGGPAMPSARVYFYCSRDHDVYMGEDAMWMLYQQSWIAPAIAIAHETGHGMQDATGALNSVDGPSSMIREENQADCVAGGYTAFVQPQTHVGLGDVPGILDMWAGIAQDPNDPERDHGTFLERLGSYGAGAFLGTGVCNNIGSTQIIGN